MTGSDFRWEILDDLSCFRFQMLMVTVYGMVKAWIVDLVVTVKEWLIILNTT